MTTRTVTVKLTDEIYEQAEQVAEATQRSIGEVVVDWIHPPAQTIWEMTAELDALSNSELAQIAQAKVSKKDSQQLQELLALQQQRELSDIERQEAARLVEQEDLMTLRKARALFILKQRHALPDDLAQLLA